MMMAVVATDMRMHVGMVMVRVAAMGMSVRVRMRGVARLALLVAAHRGALAGRTRRADQRENQQHEHGA